MAKYRITSPDGATYEVTAPDSATEAEVLAYAKQKFAEQVPSIDKPASVSAGDVVRGIPRQVGLFARYAIESPAQVADVFTEPVRKLLVNPLLSTLGLPQAKSTSAAAADLASSVNLPSPQGADERVVGDMVRMGLSGAGMAGAARMGANATSGVASDVLSRLAANPMQQVASAVGAGGAGGVVREAGGGPMEQAIAAMGGAVVAPLAANAVTGAANKVGNATRRFFTPDKVIDQQVDQTLNLTLKQQGIDYAGLSERIKQGMRAEAKAAIASGKPLDPAAVGRLLEFQKVPGSTPTRGMISQDPAQITQERNLAKIEANMGSVGDIRLSNVEQKNTAALLSALDEAGAKNAPDAYATGQQAISALDLLQKANKARIDQLYKQARDSAGRSLPLDGAAWTSKANQLLDEAMLGGKLPADVAKTMNRVATGEIPFTVEIAEQIKTRIGDLQRATNDRSEKMALGLVRQALDEAPIRPSPMVNPGNLHAVPGTVPPSASVTGQASIDAFNKARAANRAWMGLVEKTPALQAVVEGVEPDKFVQKFIIGQGATVADVRALSKAASINPEASDAIRKHIVAHLRNAATGQANDINKFRADSYNNALNAIGDRKLSAFFSPEEIDKLRAVGKVSNYMMAQPAGSAVNNSNSGALVAAKAIDMLDAIAGKMPFGVDTTIRGFIRGAQQRSAMNASPALLQPLPSESISGLLGLPAAYSGLLATQVGNDR